MHDVDQLAIGRYMYPSINFSSARDIDEYSIYGLYIHCEKVRPVNGDGHIYIYISCTS